MGYRSDVTLGIAFPDDATMVGFITKLRLAGRLDHIDLDKFIIRHYDQCADGKNCRLITVLMSNYDGIKWYNHYEDIDQLTAMLESAKELGYPTMFMRIGEDAGDIEEELFEDNEHLIDEETAEIKTTENITFSWWDYDFGIHRYIETGEHSIKQQRILDFLKQPNGESDEQPRETIES